MLSYQDSPKELPFASNERLQVLKLPYQGEGFELAVFLPRRRHELALFSDTISGEEVQDLLANATSEYVDVKIPKFHVETREDLSDVLEELGIQTAFTATADFSGISSTPFHISKVDEEGTKAAAATIIAGEGGSPPGGPIYVQFHADEPFLYAVLFNNRPLFFGQYL